MWMWFIGHWFRKNTQWQKGNKFVAVVGVVVIVVTEVFGLQTSELGSGLNGIWLYCIAYDLDCLDYSKNNSDEAVLKFKTNGKIRRDNPPPPKKKSLGISASSYIQGIKEWNMSKTQLAKIGNKYLMSCNVRLLKLLYSTLAWWMKVFLSGRQRWPVTVGFGNECLVIPDPSPLLWSSDILAV